LLETAVLRRMNYVNHSESMKEHAERDYHYLPWKTQNVDESPESSAIVPPVAKKSAT
jgi:hypothetical protein